MSVIEIRNSLPTMVIWMAKEAVMEGVKSYRKSQRECDNQTELLEAGKPYNYTLGHAYYESVAVASEILWKLFASCSADCQAAIKSVAKKRDGHCGDADDYFDDFVVALEIRLGDPVRIRTVE